MMARLDALKEFLLTNLYVIVAVLLIVMLAGGLVYFYVNSIDPGLKSRERLSAQLEDTQRRAGSVRRLQDEPTQYLQNQLTITQARWTTLANTFLTPDQASKINDILYRQAQASGVTIVDLQVPPTPTALPTPLPTQTRPAPTPTSSSATPAKSSSSASSAPPTATPQPAPPTPTRAPSVSAPAPSNLYYVRGIRLRVQGTPRQLIDFVSHIKELSAKNILVNNFSIIGNETSSSATLNLDIALYVFAGSLTGAQAPK